MHRRFGSVCWALACAAIGWACWAEPAAPDERATAKLRTLSAEQARDLVRSHDGPLDLSGLTELDGDTAAILAGHEGDLRLDGLQSLTVDVAAALAAHGVGGVAAVNVDAIAARVAEAVEEGGLEEDRLRAIMGEFGGGGVMPALSLGGLAALPADVAAALARHVGRLELDGLRALDDASAEALAGHIGPLSLAGLAGNASLSAAAAQALERHLGEIFVPESVLAGLKGATGGGPQPVAVEQP